ncbi:unnamed protein product [Penicillium salamii]|uniref:Uncharacterized protein n=1 Tax=Penicillium salamii TaxID=1612424 RepID=A0A9W4NYW6_9EURO|nr:unnamed protein product [Penicillium salamii]
MSTRVPFGSEPNSNRIFIDLTDSDDKEVPVSTIPFVTTLAHRSPAKVQTTVPSKRSLDPSNQSSDVSNDEPIVAGRARRQRLFHSHDATPSPPLPKVSVVIPSPTTHQRRQIALASSISSPSTNGMSVDHYPTNEEEERVFKADYPLPRERRAINRKNVPLSFKSDVASTLKLDSPAAGRHLAKLRANLQEKLDGIQGPPITPVVSCPKLLAKLADNFVFINEYQYRAGVVPLSEDFICGCTCVNGCDPAQCDCIAQEEETDGLIVPYERCDKNPNLFVITQDFLHRKSMIFECTSSCNCQGERCWNHVVQNGRTVRLEIFDTGPRGFGLRSPDPIYAGQFIDHYLGEVITKADADAREALSEGTHAQSYLFDLDWWIGFEDVDEENINVIDGRKFGSASRFLNHSCNPNCKIVAVSTKNHSDKRLYNLAFFSYRDIPPGTELTFDYNANAGTENSTPQKIDPDAVPCLCGEKDCRGQLWPNQRKVRGA